ncbi:uncharacterized protein N7469_007896 [Penicillium citrinum]|uniref:Methyltransferase domain-containing protein n=1 Tax=Penicillium citrinum TaxID=5077 RepID=A0A9W9NSX3_PENCI|nr:uncharacterized protein N7469_007896 [Penicillium citrinum]KAJ5224393.1 hypothetical protein N7469_007896 [Penicillium citrinum]
MLNTNDKYVFGRDKRESKRLDAQHDLLLKVTENSLIHPKIPTDTLFSVADIATGTGIWLKDTSEMLDKVDGHRCYYHGFDISAAQFPEDSDTIAFSLHDITEPFPEEHWNRYDLVHVRLLVAALEESEYSAAVCNIQQILKPGGYLQWEEIDEDTYISKDNPVFLEVRRCFDVSFKAEKKCFQASTKIFEECMGAGYQEVERLTYSSDWDENIRLETERRFVAIFETLYASLLLRSGEVDTELAARKRTEDLVKQYKSLCESGNSPPVKLMRVIARKQQ